MEVYIAGRILQVKLFHALFASTFFMTVASSSASFPFISICNSRGHFHLDRFVFHI